MTEKVYKISGIKIPEINFGKIEYIEDEGDNVAVVSITDVCENDYCDYISSIKKEGFLLNNSNKIWQNTFEIYTSNEDALYTCFYPQSCEMRIVCEKNSAYLTYSDSPKDKECEILVTQIALETFGMSYVIRLTDGRFIIIDGGRELEPDADKIMRCLKKQSIDENIVIAAWIMTHAHEDHYPCFMIFMEKYRELVEIQKFIYNFPKYDENATWFVKALEKEIPLMKRMFKEIETLGVPVYKAHTGQIYKFKDVTFEVLSSTDDTFMTDKSTLNSTSIVTKMYAKGQTILWTADLEFDYTRFVERWREHLKSDLLQVPHHGFVGGTEEGYEYIRPSVCLAPIGREYCYELIDIFMKPTLYLMRMECVDEFYEGGEEVTVPVPYVSSPYKHKFIEEKIKEGHDTNGAKTWIFGNLNTSNPDDFKFTAVNTSISGTAEVYVHLKFEDPSYNIRSIKINVPTGRITKFDLTNSDDVEHDVPYYNPVSFAKMGLPENKEFVAQFKSSAPIVIYKKDNQPIYYK